MKRTARARPMTSTISPDDTQHGVDKPALERTGPITAPLTNVEPPEMNEPARKQSDPWLPLAGLVALGGISGVAYLLGFVRPYFLPDYYARPLLDLAKINGHSTPSANEWALAWAVLFACYYIAF